ncbi:hypothetical protein QTO34_015073 [Cnephaeus nilssonii]|uniref:Uncharacterized protein n=1 Tax=Cnephaeus nilssonii TaxID=3371016 RepID=A0AA40I3F2_CNENI|nr:hypothetical protein QTO34_015073 [Eptesicus nilssonii]
MAEAGLGRGHRGPGAGELPLQAPPTPSRYGNPVFCLLGLVFRTRLTGKSKTASCLQGPDSGLYLASYESESPENHTEKERWKSLR